MAFDRENFFKSCGHYGRGSAIADGFEALHAELAELKAACLGLKDRIAGIEGRVCGRPEDTPDAPDRETGWAVVDGDGDPYTTTGYMLKRDAVNMRNVVWFSEETSKAFCGAVRALGDTGSIATPRAALLYKDTLEEVPGDA